MKIYTKSGDRGETGLLHGVRVGKDDLRVELCGLLDHANAHIGSALALVKSEAALGELVGPLRRVQRDLFEVGRIVATPSEIAVPDPLPMQFVADLEADTDKWSDALPPLTRFILPGGTPPAAALHVARTAVRNAERSAVRLFREDGRYPDSVLMYLNRLSDFLFVAARIANHLAGVEDEGVYFS